MAGVFILGGLAGLKAGSTQKVVAETSGVILLARAPAINYFTAPDLDGPCAIYNGSWISTATGRMTLELPDGWRASDASGISMRPSMKGKSETILYNTRFGGLEAGKIYIYNGTKRVMHRCIYLTDGGCVFAGDNPVTNVLPDGDIPLEWVEGEVKCVITSPY